MVEQNRHRIARNHKTEQMRGKLLDNVWEDNIWQDANQKGTENS